MKILRLLTARWIILAVTLCVAFPSMARVYQWADPETGTAYMSGMPPAWYRTKEGGPRVLVFEKGKLVDDTEWRASREREKSLRAKAVKELEGRKLAEEKKLLEAKQAASEETKDKEEEAGAVIEEEPDEAKLKAALEQFFRLGLQAAQKSSEADNKQPETKEKAAESASAGQ